MPVLLLFAALVAATGAVATLAAHDARLGLLGLTACLAAAAFVADPLPDPPLLAVRLSGALLSVAILRAVDAPAERERGRAIGAAAEAGPDRRVAPDRTSRGWSATRGFRRGAGARPSETHLGWLPIVAIAAAGLATGLAIGTRLELLTASSVAAAASGSVTLGSIANASGALASPAGSGQALTVGIAGLLAAIAIGPTLLGPMGLRRAMAAVLVVEAVELLRLGLAPAPAVAEEIVAALVLVTVAATGAMLAVRRPSLEGAEEAATES